MIKCGKSIWATSTSLTQLAILGSPELVGFLWSRPHRGRCRVFQRDQIARSIRDVCPVDSAAGGDAYRPPPLRLRGLHRIAGSLGRRLSLLRRRALGCDMVDRGGLTPASCRS